MTASSSTVGALDLDPRAAVVGRDGAHPAELLDDAGEHQAPSRRRVERRRPGVEAES